MIAGTQAVSPMSRFMAGSAASGVCAVDTTNAEAIEIAGDAIVISMNNMHQTACDPGNPGAANDACPGYSSGGLNHSRTLGTGVTLTSWKDTLRLVYLGLAPNDFPLAASQNGLTTGPGDQVLAANIARRDCEDPSRVELVNHFGELFNVDCGNDGGCTKLQHAFRRDENSGTTDFFRETLGVGIGHSVWQQGLPVLQRVRPGRHHQLGQQRQWHGVLDECRLHHSGLWPVLRWHLPPSKQWLHCRDQRHGLRLWLQL